MENENFIPRSIFGQTLARNFTSLAKKKNKFFDSPTREINDVGQFPATRTLEKSSEVFSKTERVFLSTSVELSTFYVGR